MRTRWISFLSLLSIVLTGCGVSQVKATEVPNLSPSDQNEIESFSTPIPATPPQSDDMPKDLPLSIPRSPSLPALIEKAKADLAQRLSIPISQIKAIETKEAAWPDTSLGCPQPDIVYAQIPTPGYLVTLENAGNKYEYHVGIHGNVLYCENPTPPFSGGPENGYPFPTLIP